MVTGQFEFVHNVRVPGMLHGRVVRPPAVGATVMSVDESSVKDMPGLVKVVVKKNFVGVVAEKPWQAIAGGREAESHLDARQRACPNQADFYDHLRNQKPTRDTLLVDSKDVEQKLGQAATVVKATYHSSVSNAWIGGQLLRGCRRAGRQGHHLVAHAGRLVSDAARRRWSSA